MKVGDMIHFHASRTSPAWAAVVTQVLPDDKVNCAMWNEEGRPIAHPMTHIPLVGLGADPPEQGPYCTELPA